MGSECSVRRSSTSARVAKSLCFDFERKDRNVVVILNLNRTHRPSRLAARDLISLCKVIWLRSHPFACIEQAHPTACNSTACSAPPQGRRRHSARAGCGSVLALTPFAADSACARGGRAIAGGELCKVREPRPCVSCLRRSAHAPPAVSPELRDALALAGKDVRSPRPAVSKPAHTHYSSFRDYGKH